MAAARAPRPESGSGPFHLAASHAGLAITRILFHVAVLWLLADLWSWRGSAFAHHPEEGASLLLLGFAVNLLLVAGALTRPLAIVNVVLLHAVFALVEDPYTVDDVVQYFAFALAFAPAPRALSVDSEWRGERSLGAPLPTGFVLLVFAALALLYADSVYYKVQSRIWLSGSAFFLGAALPHWGWAGLPAWLEHGPLLKALTWSALAYEALFPLLAVPALRRPLLAMGFGLHVGSSLILPLPQFGLVMCAALCLFMRFERILPGSPSGADVAPRWWAHGFGHAALALMLLSQLWLHLQPPGERNLLSRAIGTNRWIIFVDSQFLLPAPLYRFVLASDDARAIPSFDAAGRPTTRDRYWKVVGFDMRSTPDPAPMLSRYLLGWFAREGLPSAPVRVYCKDVSLRTLEVDLALDDEIRARPWTPCALVSFERR